MIEQVSGVDGQYTVEGVSRYKPDQLAEMVMMQIQAGFTIFRFWCRVKKSSEYQQGVFSTYPLHVSVMTKRNRADDIRRYIERLPGKVFRYWMAIRNFMPAA